MRRAPFVSRWTLAATAATILATVLAIPAGAQPTALTATAAFPSALSDSVALVRLTFDGPVTAADLPLVRSSPVLPISWEQTGPDTVEAVTTTMVTPDVDYRLSVPTSVSCETTCVTVQRKFKVLSGAASQTWLLELLARLNYLPVSFTPLPSDPTPLPKVAQVPGTFTWRFPDLPAAFKAQWSEKDPGVILTGAIMHFQSENGLLVTGAPNGATWSALLRATRANAVNPTTYNYVYVTTTLPEHLVLYRHGEAKFTTLVNTGIPEAPTAPGTFPVYSRFTVTTMSGTYPDGQTYSDPGIPWVSYFHGGDALHGFLRASYGFPQSLGCVEMPYNDAKVMFKYTPIGTLVTVQ